MTAVSAAERGLPEPPGFAEKPLVLFVDDDPNILASIKRLLINEPYELLTTESPAQALKWVEEKVVSVIVFDQVMPGHLGTELVEEIRARSPATRCAILTAYPEGGKLLRSVSQTAICTIGKPWDDEDLKRTIRRLLQDREKE